QYALPAEAGGLVGLLPRIQISREMGRRRQMAGEMPDSHRHASQNLGDVELLQQRQSLRRPARNVDDAAHRSSSPAMTLSVPSVAIASATVPPRMIFSNAAMFGKQGGRTFMRSGRPRPSERA